MAPFQNEYGMHRELRCNEGTTKRQLELRLEYQGGWSEMEVKGMECGIREGSPYNYRKFETEVEVPGLNSRFRRMWEGEAK